MCCPFTTFPAAALCPFCCLQVWTYLPVLTEGRQLLKAEQLCLLGDAELQTFHEGCTNDGVTVRWVAGTSPLSGSMRQPSRGAASQPRAGGAPAASASPHRACSPACLRCPPCPAAS